MAKLIWSQYSLTVIREKDDPKFYGTVNAAGESNFLYWLKNLLNAQGFDLIKTKMSKDGHLVDDIQQYLRIRSQNSVKKGHPNIVLYNSFWALRGLNDDWNKGKVVIRLETNWFQDVEDTSEFYRNLISED